MLPFSTIVLSLSGHEYYSVFYLAGFGVAGGLLLRTGFRRRYPWPTWLLLIAGVLLLLIVGTKLVAGSWVEWQYLLTHGQWVGHEERSILGGLVGAAVGLAVLRRWLGFGRDAYDAFALPLALGLAVQGIGCLLTGCCFGKPAGAWPGIHYAAGTLPFLKQVSAGLLAPNAAHSLPVHPAQLYQIGLCLAIAGVVWGTRRQAWSAGSRFQLTLALYVAGRFGLEFLRDAAGDVVGTGYWLGLKPVQWALLAAGLAGLLWVRGRAAWPSTAAPAQAACSPARRWLTLLALLVLAAAPGPGRLAPAEVWVIKSLLLVVVGLETRRLLFPHGWLRLAAGLPLGLGVLAVFTMSQAPAPADSTHSEAARRYTTVSVGGLAGQSKQYFDYPYGCSGSRLPVGTYRQRFQVASIGVARTLPVGRAGTFTMSLEGSRGESRFQPTLDSMYSIRYDSNLKPFFEGKARLYAISPYFELAHPKYFRFGLGAHLGDVAYDYVYRPGKLSRFRMQVLMEGGRFNTFYAHIGVNHGLLGLGNGMATFGVGSGFGSSRSRLLAGVAIANSEFNGVGLLDRSDGSPFPFLQGTVAVGPRWQVQSFAATNFGSIYQFHIQTHYRLPGKR